MKNLIGLLAIPLSGMGILMQLPAVAANTQFPEQVRKGPHFPMNYQQTAVAFAQQDFDSDAQSFSTTMQAIGHPGVPGVGSEVTGPAIGKMEEALENPTLRCALFEGHGSDDGCTLLINGPNPVHANIEEKFVVPSRAYVTSPNTPPFLANDPSLVISNRTWDCLELNNMIKPHTDNTTPLIVLAGCSMATTHNGDFNDVLGGLASQFISEGAGVIAVGAWHEPAHNITSFLTAYYQGEHGFLQTLQITRSIQAAFNAGDYQARQDPGSDSDVSTTHNTNSGSAVWSSKYQPSGLDNL